MGRKIHRRNVFGRLFDLGYRCGLADGTLVEDCDNFAEDAVVRDSENAEFGCIVGDRFAEKIRGGSAAKGAMASTIAGLRIARFVLPPVTMMVLGMSCVNVPCMSMTSMGVIRSRTTVAALADVVVA